MLPRDGLYVISTADQVTWGFIPKKRLRDFGTNAPGIASIAAICVERLRRKVSYPCEGDAGVMYVTALD
jgi:hypothetical protein